MGTNLHTFCFSLKCFSFIQQNETQEFSEPLQELNQNAKSTSSINHHQTEQLDSVSSRRTKSVTIFENGNSINESAETTSEPSSNKKRTDACDAGI